MSKNLGADLGKAFADTARHIRKEDAYKDRTQTLIVKGFNGLTQRVKVGELFIIPAQRVKGWSLNTGETYERDEPDKFHVMSNSFLATQLANRLHKPKAADLRKVERLDARIRELQKLRREAVEAAFTNGAPVDVKKARAAAEQNSAVAKRNYPANARVPKV